MFKLTSARLHEFKLPSLVVHRQRNSDYLSNSIPDTPRASLNILHLEL